MSQPAEHVAFIHNDFVPLSHAFVHVSDLAVQRGYGVFDFFRVQNGHPLFLSQYLDRFYASAQKLHLTVPYDRPALTAIIYELIQKNNIPVSGMKMILTGGYSTDGYTLPEKANLIITETPLALPGADLLEKGIRIITHEYTRELPLAKTINYSMGIRLQARLRETGAADVLYHHQGTVTEFPRANFFIVTTDGAVITPVGEVLAGITRQNVLNVAAPNYAARAGKVTLADIEQAAEAFVTSTTKRILPIVAIDGKPIGTGQPGPVTRVLLQNLIRLEEEDRQAVN